MKIKEIGDFIPNNKLFKDCFEGINRFAISGFYVTFILSLYLIYDEFTIFLHVIGNRLLVVGKTWRHVFVIQGEAYARTVCPIARGG